MEEGAPILRLEILQGPRQGETLEFKPGSAVRIGRLVKGNTLPIKDSGISTKHLSILNESTKWILRDLDSSNGTVLNDSQIPPNTPFTLHHGSIIKIGEFTSIHVIFLPFQQPQNARPPRRNPTRRGRTAAAPDPVPVPSEPVSKRPRGRAVKGTDKSQAQSVDESDVNVDVVDEQSERVDQPARVKRKSKRARSVVKESSAENLIIAEEKAEEPPARVTRKPKRRTSVENLILAEEKVEEPNSTRNPSLVVISVSSDDNLDVPVVEEPKKTRATRNLKNKSAVTAKIENAEKKRKRGVAGKRGLVKEDEDGNGVKEACDGKEKGNSNKDDESWPDLNKMTLGEWFDFLEVYLPKQIIDETEEMIDSMTKKTERLCQYIAEMQQQNARDKPASEIAEMQQHNARNKMAPER